MTDTLPPDRLGHVDPKLFGPPGPAVVVSDGRAALRVSVSSGPETCHPTAPWLCSFCGVGVEVKIVVWGGRDACGECYSILCHEVGQARLRALDDLERRGRELQRTYCRCLHPGLEGPSPSFGSLVPSTCTTCQRPIKLLGMP